QITKDYAGKTPILVCVLKGSILFTADLMRYIDLYTEVDTLSVSSYAGGTVSTGVVKLVKDLSNNIEGRDVIIVEDILDSGKTLSYIRDLFETRHPASIAICTLLDKPSRRSSDIQADYVGFTIPDEFVIGYGLDYDEKYRNLPFVGVLKPSVYSPEDAELVGAQQ
ncbi:MAG: hypoxanthine phosphoribosyltransferase, partial [Oscillospiraceae bacterium]|nr:hypoxanthine phosphoribosyltransferase [Oscillospiraceae bacterium]